MNSDPTMQLVESLKKGSKKDWGRIIDNVPIFVAHRWYERTTEDGYKEARTVLTGEEPPAAKDGWKFVYEVSEEDLDTVAAEINKNFEQRATPMKILVGHTRPGQPQESQPSLVGFGIDAKIGFYGPGKTRCVMAKHFFKRGLEDAAAEYPQRSPEFKQSTKTITGVALLKTDPRLPLGFHAYGNDDDLYFYGMGAMADEKPAEGKEPEAKPMEKPAEKPAETPEAKPAAPVSSEPEELEPLQEHEVKFANRLANHYGCSPAAFKYLGEQHKQYEASQAAMAAASPTNGKSPATPIGAEKPVESTKKLENEDELMSDPELQRQYEERIAALEQDRATMYAEAKVSELRNKHRVKIRDVKAFTTKLIAAKMKGEADAQAVLDDALQNYARDERAPVGRDFLPIAQSKQEEGPKDSDDLDLENPETVNELTRYAEESKIDIQTDDGWNKAVEAFAAAKKKRNQRQAQTA